MQLTTVKDTNYFKQWFKGICVYITIEFCQIDIHFSYVH